MKRPSSRNYRTRVVLTPRSAATSPTRATRPHSDVGPPSYAARQRRVLTRAARVKSEGRISSGSLGSPSLAFARSPWRLAWCPEVRGTKDTVGAEPRLSLLALARRRGMTLAVLLGPRLGRPLRLDGVLLLLVALLRLGPISFIALVLELMIPWVISVLFVRESPSSFCPVRSPAQTPRPSLNRPRRARRQQWARSCS
jgi:hypothetical protein